MCNTDHTRATAESDDGGSLVEIALKSKELPRTTYRGLRNAVSDSVGDPSR